MKISTQKYVDICILLFHLNDLDEGLQCSTLRHPSEESDLDILRNSIEWNVQNVKYKHNLTNLNMKSFICKHEKLTRKEGLYILSLYCGCISLISHVDLM